MQPRELFVTPVDLSPATILTKHLFQNAFSAADLFFAVIITARDFLLARAVKERLIVRDPTWVFVA
jgi:hypothetical protein